MKLATTRTTLIAGVISLLAAFNANASLVLEQYASGTPTPGTIGGYTMTDFDVVNDTLSGDTSTVTSPFGDLLTFTDKNGVVIDLSRGLADSTSWWVNGESSDYDIFTTGLNWVTVLLPTNTRALSFNLGANVNASGWLSATETDSSGNDTRYDFALGPDNTPGFGLYTNNSAGECSTLTSVTIEPLKWGIGNFSINNDSCSVDAPEPPTTLLLGVGITGLLLLRRYAGHQTARHN